jgi:hypothetical protein
MKIKIGARFYEFWSDGPIMIILTEEEKKQIASMINTGEDHYFEIPQDEYWTRNNYENLREWAEIGDKKIVFFEEEKDKKE